MNTININSNWQHIIVANQLTRLPEVILTTLLGNMPKILFGDYFRRLFYPEIFSHFGKAVDIETNVKFYGTANIRIGDWVKISDSVRLNALGNENNQISIGSYSTLERGVDLGTLENGPVLDL